MDTSMKTATASSAFRAACRFGGPPIDALFG
jgi:hypothetical protein